MPKVVVRLVLPDPAGPKSSICITVNFTYLENKREAKSINTLSKRVSSALKAKFSEALRFFYCEEFVSKVIVWSVDSVRSNLMKVHLSEESKVARRSYVKYAAGLVVAAVVAVAGYAWTTSREVPYQTVITGQAIALPKPKKFGFMSMEEAVAKRRSIRAYTPEPLSLEEVSQLLWAAQGITDPASGKRAAPSAGMTYPLEIYLAIGEEGVKDLPRGVYNYIPQKHSITKILDDDVRYPLQEAALRQTWVGEAPITIIVAAIYERTTVRYGDRGMRYVYIEVGHVAENVFLQAVALNLGTVPIGAFTDDDVQKVLGLPKEVKPIYIMPVGRV